MVSLMIGLYGIFCIRPKLLGTVDRILPCCNFFLGHRKLQDKESYVCPCRTLHNDRGNLNTLVTAHRGNLNTLVKLVVPCLQSTRLNLFWGQNCTCMIPYIELQTKKWAYLLETQRNINSEVNV